MQPYIVVLCAVCVIIEIEKKEAETMSTYMRRILVPKDHLPVVANYIAEHFYKTVYD